MMPVYFIGHGSPMNAIQNTEFSRAWSELRIHHPKPKAILCISAHWLTRGSFITSNPMPPTIHDFGGFPKELFEVQYPAPGDPKLASEIVDYLGQDSVTLDDSWGLDHGSWSILRHIYPNADVPILQFSIKNTIDGKFHFEMGQKLKYLREKDVLIIGSGNLIHNLGLVDWSKVNNPEYGYDWAIRFNEQLKTLILNHELDKLIHYQSLGKDADLAIPTAEHYIPFLYVLGASLESDPIHIWNDKVVMGSLNMTSVTFG